MKEGLEKKEVASLAADKQRKVTLLPSQSRVDLSPALRLLKSILPGKTSVKVT